MPFITNLLRRTSYAENRLVRALANPKYGLVEASQQPSEKNQKIYEGQEHRLYVNRDRYGHIEQMLLEEYMDDTKQDIVSSQNFRFNQFECPTRSVHFLALTDGSNQSVRIVLYTGYDNTRKVRTPFMHVILDYIISTDGNSAVLSELNSAGLYPCTFYFHEDGRIFTPSHENVSLEIVEKHLRKNLGPDMARLPGCRKYRMNETIPIEALNISNQKISHRGRGL